MRRSVVRRRPRVVRRLGEVRRPREGLLGRLGTLTVGTGAMLITRGLRELRGHKTVGLGGVRRGAVRSLERRLGGRVRGLWGGWGKAQSRAGRLLAGLDVVTVGLVSVSRLGRGARRGFADQAVASLFSPTLMSAGMCLACGSM